MQNTSWYSAGLSAAHIVADAPDQQLDIADAPYLGERSTIERQLEWADIDAVTLDQATSTAQAFAVDIGTVGASEVAQHNGSIHYLKRRVTARDIRMIEDDLPRHRLTADGQTVVEGHPVSHGGNPPSSSVCIIHAPETVSAEIDIAVRGASTATFSTTYLHKHRCQRLALTQINPTQGSAELAWQLPQFSLRPNSSQHHVGSRRSLARHRGGSRQGFG